MKELDPFPVNYNFVFSFSFQLSRVSSQDRGVVFACTAGDDNA